MEQILDGVYLIEGIGSANVFLIDNSDGFVLVDSGIFMKTHMLISQIERNGFPISRLKQIVLTHCHCDHIGGVSVLVEQSGAKVAAHQDDIPFILQERIIDGPYHGMMVEEQKTMKRLNCAVKNVDIELNHGDLLDVLGGLEVIQVPGHTPGSIALYQEKQRIMFFGDVIRNNQKNGLVIGKPEKFNLDTEQTKADAQKLIRKPIDYALFSHGKPILQHTQRMLQELLSE